MSKKILLPGALNGSQALFLLASVLGLIARFLVSGLGHNIDMDAFFIDHFNSIKTFGEPWSSNHYNYGFFWGYFSYLLNLISGHDFSTFRLLIVLTLGFVDIAIAWQIKTKFGNLYLLFLFNPVSILISGFHNQFDNIAILFGLLALNRFHQSSPKFGENSSYIFLMSVSLIVKHDLIFFVIWLAFRNLRNWKGILISLFPIPVFFMSFLPFIQAYPEIWANVFRYKSFNNGPLYYVVFLRQNFSSVYIVLFIGLILLTGWLLRNVELFHFFYLYLVFFVALSSSIANQYLAIAAIGLICITGYFSIPYLAYGWFLLVNHPDGPNLGVGSFLDSLASKYVYLPVPVILFLTLLLNRLFPLIKRWKFSWRSTNEVP